MVIHQSDNLVIILVIILLQPWFKCSSSSSSHSNSDGLLVMKNRVSWSIPPNTDYYINWSSNQSFHIGDTLVFEFESGFHNVMQVSRREYEECTSENPFQTFLVGPATVTLLQSGVYYFICSLPTYCDLGQKLLVMVDRHRISPSSPFPPPPLPLRPPPPCDNDVCSMKTQPPWAHVSHVDPSPPFAPSSSSTGSISFVEWIQGRGAHQEVFVVLLLDLVFSLGLIILYYT